MSCTRIKYKMWIIFSLMQVDFLFLVWSVEWFRWQFYYYSVAIREFFILSAFKMKAVISMFYNNAILYSYLFWCPDIVEYHMGGFTLQYWELNLNISSHVLFQYFTSTSFGVLFNVAMRLYDSFNQINSMIWEFSYSLSTLIFGSELRQ